MITLICGITPEASHVALEHLAIGRKAGDAFLDARAAGIVQPDHRRAVLDGHVHDLADFRAWVSDTDPPMTVKSWLNT
jgi:hypothetical protein